MSEASASYTKLTEALSKSSDADDHVEKREMQSKAGVGGKGMSSRSLSVCKVAKAGEPGREDAESFCNKP